VADHPLLLDPAAATRLEPHLDAAGKIPRALDALGPIADRDVVLVDGGSGRMAAELAGVGARLTVVDPTPVAPEAGSPGAAHVGGPAGLGLPEASADVIVGCWSVYRGVDPVEMAEADRVLRPEGRLLVLHDYGRDDVSQLADPDLPEYASWSRRDGPFLQAGFRVRVVHAWWTFASIEEAGEILAASFGERGSAAAASLRRPRLSWNVAVYHRDRGAS
jgi:SAM-dependent methyltransferase